MARRFASMLVDTVKQSKQNPEQTNKPQEEKTERMFTLEEALEIYRQGMVCGGSGHVPSDGCDRQYFSQRFEIDISNK